MKIINNLLFSFSDSVLTLNEELFESVYKKEWQNLYGVVNSCVVSGDSTSVILMGGHGVGKTTLVRLVLSRIRCDVGDVFFEVHLNGHLHTDENSSLQEVITQLNLLETLNNTSYTSTSEKLMFLLSEFGNSSKKACVFILEGFDLFCDHKNQAFLYNLLDAVQGCKVPICVVGVTTRLDVMELFEKRVKSRFAHRLVPMFGIVKFVDFLSVATAYLSVNTDCSHNPFTLKASVADKWNYGVQKVVQDDIVIGCLRNVFLIIRNVRFLLDYLRVVLAHLQCSETSQLSSAHFTDAWAVYGADHRINMLKGLSILELCLIISMRRLLDADAEPVCFAQVEAEFRRMTKERGMFGYLSSGTLLKAFEILQSLELVTPAAAMSEAATSASLRRFRLLDCGITSEELCDVANSMDDVPTNVSQWASSLGL